MCFAGSVLRSCARPRRPPSTPLVCKDDIILIFSRPSYFCSESHIGVANRLNKEIPNSHILDQV